LFVCRQRSLAKRLIGIVGIDTECGLKRLTLTWKTQDLHNCSIWPLPQRRASVMWIAMTSIGDQSPFSTKRPPVDRVLIEQALGEDGCERFQLRVAEIKLYIIGWWQAAKSVCSRYWPHDCCIEFWRSHMPDLVKS
jgi:hypothetical protein